MKVMFRGIAMLCVLQLLFFTGTAHSQERDSATVGNHKILYGLHAGFTLNTVLPPHTSGGDHTNPFYFHNSNSFYIGLNIEA